MIKIKEVDLTLATADQLHELGYAITLENDTIQIERED